MQSGLVPLTKPLNSSTGTCWVPKEYQLTGAKLMLDNPAMGLLLDPGMGKTSTSYYVMRELLLRKEAKGFLVIAPLKPAQLTWPAEQTKWSNFSDIDVCLLHGKNKDKLLEAGGKHVYLINPEGLDWLFEPIWDKRRVMVRAARLKYLLERFDCLIVDESTKFKNPMSKRFLLLKTLLKIFKRRYILTGTIAPNGLIDLWSQIYILDQGEALERFITHYRNKYFYQDPRNDFNYLPFQESERRIAEKIEPLVYRLRAKDYLQMPELTFHQLRTDMPPGAARMYEKMEEDLIVQLEENPVVANNQAVATGKLRQIANGALYTGNGHDFQPLHDAKIELLLDLIDQLNGAPLLLAVEFHFEIHLIRKYGKIHIPMLGENPRIDKDLVAMFNAGMIPVLAGNPASVGHGLNLQDACGHVAFYSLTWNLDNYIQFIDRVYRQGNPNARVMVYALMIQGTIDEAVWSRLCKKDAVQSSLLETVKRVRAARMGNLPFDDAPPCF